MPSCWHVIGVQLPPPHTPGVLPPPHVSGKPHVPQLEMRLPQPSPAGPQLYPCCAHVSGMQPFMPPHWPGTPPPPHVCGGVHVPQLAMMPPPPSLAGPHLLLDGHG